MATMLPYEFQEGQKAYAAKVMANFYALLGKLNGVEIPGYGLLDIDAAMALLQDQLAHKITSGQVGNARQVTFADGETMQEKLDDGDLNGADGVVSTSDGMYYFYLDGNGHLMLVTRSEVQGEAFSINEEGHLIYTVTDPGTDPGDPKTYDLGSVKGPPGVGNMAREIYDPNNEATDIFAYVDTAVSAISGSSSVNTQVSVWDNGVAEITVEGITASKNFYIGPANNSTQAQREAWRAALVTVTGQTDGGVITLTADGTEPDITIPLTVVLLP